MKYTIEDLANGEVICENDGTLEELRKVLKKAFPNDNIITQGCNNYYFKSDENPKEWGSVRPEEYIYIPKEIRNKPIRSVKDFLKNEESEHNFKQGETILFRDTEEEKWEELMFVCEFPINKDGYKYMATRWDNEAGHYNQWMEVYLFKMAKPKPKSLREEFLQQNGTMDTNAYIEWLEGKLEKQKK